MNREELKAVRLFFDFDIESEAARFIAADNEHKKGVKRQSWQRWEKGAYRIPEGIVKNIEDILARRSKFLNYILEQGIKEIRIPYDIQEKDPLEFKIQRSVIYELYIKGVIRISDKQ